MARTLERLSAAGWRDFYEGELGDEIVSFVASQGGILTREDMSAFTPRITRPCSGTYHGAEIHTAIPPNGGFSVLDAMEDLEKESLPPENDPKYWEIMSKVLARMWRVRLADSWPAGAAPHGTVHVATADVYGNVVSATISTGGLWGACFAVPGTGIILSHGMCRFDPHPGRSNSPGPRKRPLNNVCPLLIRMADRDVAIGTRGGRRIVSACVQLAHRIIDYGASASQAAAAPRIHTITGDPVEISPNFDPAVRSALERAGNHVLTPDELARAVHGAEILRPECAIRAGGNDWSAGI